MAIIKDCNKSYLFEIKVLDRNPFKIYSARHINITTYRIDN